MVEHERTGPVDWLSWAFSRICMWGPALIVGIIFYEVVMRYVFAAPTLWVNEMSLWVGGAIYLTSGLYAMQQRSHIRIFVLYDLMPSFVQKFFNFLAILCLMIFAFAVVWGGFGEAAAKFARWETFGTAFDPPIPATNKPLVLITMLFVTLQAISNLVRDWPAAAGVRKGFDILSTVIIVGLAVYALPRVLNPANSVPYAWKISIVAVLGLSSLIVIYGLWRDFNRTPAPFVESHDPADELDLPDEVLSGRPPPEGRHPEGRGNAGGI